MEYFLHQIQQDQAIKYKRFLILIIVNQLWKKFDKKRPYLLNL